MPNLNQAYQWCINTCNAPNVGYSQGYRNQQTVNGVTYYDCSSLLWYALKNGGFDVVSATGANYPMNTESEPRVLTNLGFKEVDINGQWLSGDILWRRSGTKGHTEMVYTGGLGKGITMGAHTSSYPLDKEVSINTEESYASDYMRLYRYGDGGAIGYGSSLYVISAICGNWWTESNINPGLWESLIVNNYGYGLGQWTDNSTGTNRRTKLFEWLDEQGYPHDSAQGQLEYFIHENTWYKNGHGTNFDSLEDFLTSDSTDLQMLTYSFLQGWEGIWNGTENERLVQAKKCYDYILVHANDPNITEWVVGNRYLTESEILNNAVLVYRFLCVGVGVGYPNIPKHKIPIWMMLRPIIL